LSLQAPPLKVRGGLGLAEPGVSERGRTRFKHRYRLLHVDLHLRGDWAAVAR
jgi:hypothetical protein